ARTVLLAAIGVRRNGGMPTDTAGGSSAAPGPRAPIASRPGPSCTPARPRRSARGHTDAGLPAGGCGCVFLLVPGAPSWPPRPARKRLRRRLRRELRHAVASLPYFAPNFSPPPPYGLHSGTLPAAHAPLSGTSRKNDRQEDPAMLSVTVYTTG